jgi:hypothetical protein
MTSETPPETFRTGPNTPTPLTDSESRNLLLYAGGDSGEVVPAACSRELESELAEALDALDRVTSGEWSNEDAERSAEYVREMRRKYEQERR